ncbi:MAG: thiolase domain-containing protein [Proteobacteria bacterium]|nr:thiolase domain-containing protein [Pseudomonadota bacterium]MBU1740241.1 thiolase domain-containing protein [Pseudomonadota bacterium]
MIKFGKGNLRIPKWSRKVYMVAGGTTAYKKYFPEYKLEELVMEGVKQLLEDNNLKKSPQEIRDLISFCVYGEFADHFQDQLLCEAKVHDYLGLEPMYNVGIKTGGATGGSAILVGAQAIASGYADCVLVAGWERMDEVDTRTGNFYISTAACKDFETRMGRIYSSYYAPMANRFAWAYNLSEETRAKVAVKNRGYAMSNPYAQQPGYHTIQEVLNSPMSAYPLRFLECCAMSVGSACALLCSEKLARQLTDQPCEVHIAGGSHTLRVADRRHMDIPLLPNEEPGMYDQLIEESGRWPGFESFLAARFASYLVYRMAGIKDPLQDLDLVELHDAFTISDIQTYGDIGLRPYGQEPDYIESGDAYFGGKCPSNVSGGLLGTMHAVGATGIYQAAECLWQIQGKYDRFHGDPKIWRKWGKRKPKNWKSLQIPNAKKALWVSHAGVGSHVTVGILGKAF